MKRFKYIFSIYLMSLRNNLSLFYFLFKNPFFNEIFLFNVWVLIVNILHVLFIIIVEFVIHF